MRARSARRSAAWSPLSGGLEALLPRRVVMCESAPDRVDQEPYVAVMAGGLLGGAPCRAAAGWLRWPSGARVSPTVSSARSRIVGW